MTAKPPGSGVSSLFANAKETAAKAPWASADNKATVTLGCPACGAPQEVALDFKCRYCHAPMGADPNKAQAGGNAIKHAGAPGMTPNQQALATRFRTFTGKVMGRLRDVLAMERYGDDRYEEAQVFLRMYADEYAPSRAAVETLYRGLTGAVG